MKVLERNNVSYYSCEDIPISEIYSCFNECFSDYLIPLSLSKEQFENRMLRVEGNNVETTFIAYENSLPVGVVIGGIRQHGGIKAMRCGTMGVVPKLRGKGVASRLLQLHKACAESAGCDALFLEVIAENLSALPLYEKTGYRKIYDLSYYKHNCFPHYMPCDFKEISFPEYLEFYNKFCRHYYSWQSSVEALSRREDVKYYTAGAKGFLALSDSGAVMQIWQKTPIGKEDIISTLLSSVLQKKNKDAVTINFPNNLELAFWVQRNEFIKQDIAQYELLCVL